MESAAFFGAGFLLFHGFTSNFISENVHTKAAKVLIKLNRKGLIDHCECN